MGGGGGGRGAVAGTDPGSNIHLLRIRIKLTSNSAEKVNGISITHGGRKDRGEGPD